MSDYIKREDAIKAIKKDIMGGLNYESILNRLPSADVAEVVRCKDCKNYEHIVMAVDNEGNVTKECDFCNHWKRIISEQNVNDFCSYGERKEQEHD